MSKLFTHTELCNIGEKYLSKTYRCKVAAKELRAYTNEQPDVIGFKMVYSYLLEAKTSRSDFFADKKKPFRLDPDKGMGDFRYFICETDLIKIKDLPPKWGLIYVNKKGKARLVCGNAHNQYSRKWKHKKDLQEEWILLLSLARRAVFLGAIADGEWNYSKILNKKQRSAIDKKV